MAVPAWLDSSFRYVETALVSDAGDVIEAFADEVLNRLSTLWTRPGGNIFHSPPNAYGQFMQVTLSRVSAARLSVNMNRGGTASVATVCMDIGGTGKAFRIFTGQYHFYIESTGGAGDEFIRGGMLDLSPDPQNAHDNYCFIMGRRNYSGSEYNGSYQSPQYSLMLDANSAGQHDARTFGLSGNIFTAPGGGYIFIPAEFLAEPPGDSTRFLIAGRAWQQLLSDDGIPVGSEFSIPLDTGVFATFKAVGGYYDSGLRLLIRKS